MPNLLPPMILCFTLLVSASGAQDPASSTRPPATPTIDDFAWMAGHWQGEVMGGTFEETWNPPLGNSMIGMFKLVKDGEIAFTELVMISEVEGEFTMRVKHFDRNFVGWETKDKFVEFPLVSVSDAVAEFRGLKVERVGADQLQTTVLIQEGDAVEAVTFAASRVSADPS